MKLAPPRDPLRRPGWAQLVATAVGLLIVGAVGVVAVLAAFAVLAALFLLI